MTARLLTVLAACAALWGLPAREAAAAPTCSATMTGLNFGDVDLSGGGAHTANATLNYRCTNDQTTPRYMRVCFNIGNGTAATAAGGGHFDPRVLANSAGTLMNVQLYQGATPTIWGSSSAAAAFDPYDVAIAVPAQSGGVAGATTGSYTMRGEILASQAGLPAGSYTSSFTSNHTALRIAVVTSEASVPASCTSVTSTVGSFAFQVSANVIASCLVSADPLDFGSVDGIASGANIDATTTIRVSCSQATAYAVRLIPSNNDTNGSSAMAGQTPGNTSTVPYRLYSDPGHSVPWGSLAGNDVEGTGNGTAQSLTVYGRVPGLPNVRPDAYKDTVTVNVVY